MDSPGSEMLFRVRTVKAAPFRTLVEAIKDILTDANLEFDSTGLKIMAMEARIRSWSISVSRPTGSTSFSVRRSTCWVSI